MKTQKVGNPGAILFALCVVFCVTESHRSCSICTNTESSASQKRRAPACSVFSLHFSLEIRGMGKHRKSETRTKMPPQTKNNISTSSWPDIFQNPDNFQVLQVCVGGRDNLETRITSKTQTTSQVFQWGGVDPESRKQDKYATSSRKQYQRLRLITTTVVQLEATTSNPQSQLRQFGSIHWYPRWHPSQARC